MKRIALFAVLTFAMWQFAAVALARNTDDTPCKCGTSCNCDRPCNCVEAHEALDEVNAIRKANGLTPYVRDESLTKAAARCAAARAARFLFGHTENDFAFVPAGARADAAGCAAWYPSEGWGSCAMFDDYQFAGAAWVMGADGRRYMHLYVRGGSGAHIGQRVPLNGKMVIELKGGSCQGPACSAPVEYSSVRMRMRLRR